MKNLIVFIAILFSVQIAAQGNKVVEKDLYNHFKKTQRNYYENAINYEQVDTENKKFIVKLIEYLKNEPNSIESNFNLLVKYQFKPTTSPDGNFRIYNWSINLGGHYNFYYNIIQYRYENNNGILADKENEYRGSDIIKIFQAELNDKQYYFSYTRLNDGSVQSQNIESFRISSKGLHSDDLTSSIGFAYHRTDVFNGNDYQISFNEYTNTFTLPLVYPQTLEMTTEKVQYVFDGNKFELAPDFENIEGDLFSHFNQMLYWNDREFSEERDVKIRLENDIFKSKLIYYLTKYPELVSNNLNKLTESGLKIIKSKDGKFRSYSWSNNITSLSFANDWNVCEYSDGKQSVVFSEQAGDVLEIYKSERNDVTYYFVLYHYNGMGGTKTRYQVLKAYSNNIELPGIYGLPSDNSYSIGNGLYVNYGYNTASEDEEQPIHRAIKFNSKTGVFSAQQVDPETLKVIDEYVDYTFNGYGFKKK